MKDKEKWIEFIKDEYGFSIRISNPHPLSAEQQFHVRLALVGVLALIAVLGFFGTLGFLLRR